jgi:hypothetical protein
MNNLFGNGRQNRPPTFFGWLKGKTNQIPMLSEKVKKIPIYFGTISLVIFAFLVLSFFLGAITCLIKPGPTYERFDTKKALGDSAKEVLKWVAILQKDEELLDKASDMTCAVFRQIAQSQIDSDASPTLDTPKPVDFEGLKRRAVQKFEAVQTVFRAFNNNQPLLECFAGEDEAEFLAAYNALNAQLNDTKMKMRAQKVNTTLKFTQKYVNDAFKAFIDEKEEEEGFATNPTGPELIMKTNALMKEALQVHMLIQSLPQVAQYQKQVFDLINQQKANVSTPAGAQAKEDKYAEKGKEEKYSE